MKYPKIAEKGKIGSIETKNRLVMTAMGVGVGSPSGEVTDAFIRFYEERAKGGAGLIITEITRVNDIHGAGEYDQLSLACDDTIESFQRLAEAVHRHDSRIFVQLHHPGRESHLVLNPKTDQLVSSMAVPSYVAPEPTRALSAAEIGDLVKDFGRAAGRAKKAGIDGVEIHAAHGYLIHQFLSPFDNHREDQYGGTPENRRRFLLEIIEEIRRVCGEDYPISVRLSSSEFLSDLYDESLKLQDTIADAKACEAAGVSLLNISSGTHFTGNTIVEPTTYEQGWKIPLAAAIKKEVSIPVAATGVIRDPAYAEKILTEGDVDFVAMGRSWLADPQWGEKAISGRDEDIRKCLGCMYCFETAGNNLISGGSHAFCSVNPCMGEEASCDDSVADGEGRSVVVVGGGPAGLEASMILAKRNFHVVLFEKRERLGGQMYLASLPPHRAKMGNFILYAEKQLKDLGVEIHLNEEATADKIRALSPYAVFLTTGSVPVLPRSIPGIDRPNVYVAEDVLTERVRFSGRKIAVIGGGLTGMETAEYLQTGGNEVFEVEMVDAMGAVGFPLMIMDATSSLAKLGVRTMPGHKLLEIRENSILLEDNAGYRIEEACDAVIVALGVRAQNTLEEALKPDMKVFTAGDAKRGGRRIPDAIHEAFQVALLL